MGSIFVLMSAVLYGVTPVLIKLAYAYGASPLTVLTIRYATGAVLLWTAIGLSRVPLHFPRNAILPVVAVGTTLVPVQVFTFFLALEHLPASTASVLGYVYPLHVAWMGWLVLREPIRRDEAAILFAVVLGAMLVVGQAPIVADKVGLLALGVSTLASAFYYVVMRRIMSDILPLQALALLLVATAVVFALASGLTGRFSYPLPVPALVAILGTAVLGSLLGPLLFLAGLRAMPAARAAMLGSLEPVITVGLSVVLLGDRITALGVMGMVSVVVGIGLIHVRRP